VAIEIFVLSERRLHSIKEWQQAIDAEKLPLRLLANDPLENVQGFLPVRLEGDDSGFECYHDDAAKVMGGEIDLDFGRHWPFALGFRIIGDFAELRSAWMAATAYARASGGIVFDSSDDKIYNPAESREAVREIERSWPKMDEILQAAMKRLTAKPST
jgi:hypothetical protein